MSEEDEEMEENNIFDNISYATHAPKESVATETPIPGTDLVFCIRSISYSNGKIKVKTSLEKWERKRSDGTTPKRKERIILKDSYSLDVSHITQGKQINHFHEEE
ncbi:hypothetical protein D4R99_03765 [bacterium]|nr:MAG: hypothetical protein D4R99_03765 [bacterium]